MFPEERAAAYIVADSTGATLASASSGLHDADLTLRSGITIGLEVTQAADSTEVATWAEIRKRRNYGSGRLSRWWSVALRSGTSVKIANATMENLGLPPVSRTRGYAASRTRCA
jgi:hypothetical protein